MSRILKFDIAINMKSIAVVMVLMMMMLSLVNCFSSSLGLARSSISINTKRIKVNSNNRDVTLNMKVNDNEILSTSTSSSMNVIEKVSIMTISSILLIPLVSYSADSEAISALQIARPIFDIFVNLLSFLFICRTVISWYPKTDLNAFPYNVAAWPTEPLLAPVRDLVPPAFGVDVSSIVWVAVLSFLREILTGQQGILTLIEKNG